MKKMFIVLWIAIFLGLSFWMQTPPEKEMQIPLVVEETTLQEETSLPIFEEKKEESENKFEEEDFVLEEEVSLSQAETPSSSVNDEPVISNHSVEEVKIQEVVPEETVTLSVSCQTLLNHLDTLNSSVVEVIPPNGIILNSTKVSLQEGDTVFDVLKREMIARKIHMEYNYTPLYHSMYIEGIANIYEFDGGELSRMGV